MPKSNYTHIAVVLDRSGSMENIRKDVVLGLKHFIDEQKAQEGEATFTLAQFDSEYEMLYDMVPLKDVKAIELVPRGGTALLDAMGNTMEQVRTKIMALKEEDRPAKAVFVFITDGEENTSKKFKRERVFEMIANLQADKTIKWDIVFMGATAEGIQDSADLGIRGTSTMQYMADSGGTKCAFATLSRSMSSYRSKSGTADYTFAEEKEPELNDKVDGRDEVTFPYFSTDTKSSKTDNTTKKA